MSKYNSPLCLVIFNGGCRSAMSAPIKERSEREAVMEIIERNVGELIPYENNPRNNDSAVEYVANSIKEFGFKVPIIIDQNDVIVAGHTRLKAAERLGLETVPCIVADDLTEEQISAFRLADNKVSEKASWDFDKLQEELDLLQFDFNMDDFGFDDIPDEPDQEKEPEDIDVSLDNYQIIIDCESEQDQREKYAAIMGVGIECRLSTL